MKKPSEPSTKKASIRSHPDDGIAWINGILDELRAAKWDEEELFAVHLALEEAVMNAIKHGNANDYSKSIHLESVTTEELCQFCVTDEGTGFDPAQVPDPTDDANLDKPSGRGLMLMRHYMNRIEYNPTGNSVFLEKKRKKKRNKKSS